MKWKSTNIWYAATLAPLLTANAITAFLLLSPAWYAWLPPTIAATLILWGARRLAALPRPKSEYGEMQNTHLDLPKNYGVDVKLCPSLDRYEFIPRIAELLSPWRFPKRENPVVAISPDVLDTRGPRFMAIAVTREIERYRNGFHLKTLLHLFAPLLLLSCLVMTLFLIGGEWLGAFGLHFAAPVLVAVLLAGHFLVWNRTLSRRERDIDATLARLFSPRDVREFIAVSEQLERKNENEKHKALNEHYARERLNKLE